MIVNQEDPFKRWQPQPRAATRWQRHRAPGGVVVSHRQIYHMGDAARNPLLEEQIVLEEMPTELTLVKDERRAYPKRRR